MIPSALSLPLRLAACAVLLAGCASAPEDAPHGHWRAAEIAGAPVENMLLHADHRAVGRVRRSEVAMLTEVLEAVRAVAGAPAIELLIASGAAPNAFIAGEHDAPRIVVNLPMLRLVGQDRDLAAALFGHELAHWVLRHRAALAARQRELDEDSGLVGMLLMMAGLPFGVLAADAGALLVERRGSREAELAADALGMELARRAGFDAQAAVRLQELLAQADAGGIGFLRTHPQGAERIEALRRYGAPAQP